MDKIDASHLTAEEYEKIMYVIKRDERLRRQEEQRIFNLKAEIQRLRKRGIIKPGLDQSRVCARCLTELGRIINRGAFCPVCRKKVCKVCRVNGDDDKIWVCVVCHKQMQLKAVSGEWMREFTRSASEKMRSPSSKLISARDTIGHSFTDSLKQSFRGFYSQSNCNEESETKKYSETTKESSVETKPRTRGLPPKLPTIDSSCQRYSPPASAGSSGGSQENSPKPPLSPVMKVYHQAVDFMSPERKNVHTNEKEMVYRKIYVTSEKKSVPKVEKEVLQRKTSSRLQDSSSSSDEEVLSPHPSLCATKSSESTPSPRTPNSYKILSGIANNQATAFQFPPSPLYSRPSSHERQSSDEFSTTVSSMRSRSTSSETNDEGYGLAPQPLPRSRRISPLRKQQAIAEEMSNETISRYNYSAVECSQTSGADSGVSDCTVTSPKLFEKSKEEVSQLQKNVSEDSESSVNDVEGTVEKTTGVLFRKVTVKRRNFHDERSTESENQVGNLSKCDQQRSLVQKSKSEDFEKLVPSKFRCNKVTAVYNVPQSNTNAVDSAFVELNTASALKRFMHASRNRSLVDGPLNSLSLTKTNTKRYPKHDKAANKMLVADAEPERHFVKRKHLSFDSPTKRKIKKLSDRAKRLRDTIIPCASRPFKDYELQKKKTEKNDRYSQTIQSCDFDSVNLIARSASLPNNYCNDFSEDCNLPFRSLSVDSKLWEQESLNEYNFDTHSEIDLNLECLAPEYNEYQLVFMDSGNASVCRGSIESNVRHKERTLKVRSHIEISNGVVYVEDSDWEMCSELGDTSENISEEASDCECSGIDTCLAKYEKRNLCQDSEADNKSCQQTYELNRQRSFAPKYVNTIKEFAFGDVLRTGNECKEQVNNSQRVVTLHTNTRERLKSVKQIRCCHPSNECTAQTANLMNCACNRREETFFYDSESAFAAVGTCDEFEGSKSDRIPEAAIVSGGDQRLIGSEDVFSAKRSDCLPYVKSGEQVCDIESNSEQEEGKERIDVDVAAVAGNQAITCNALSAFGLRKTSREHGFSSPVIYNSVVCAKTADVFQTSACVNCSSFLQFKEVFSIYDSFLRPLVKKDFCLNSIKLAVNVDDVSKQIVVRNASLESAGCVGDCLCCIKGVGRSRIVIGKHAMDSERVNVDTCESILHATENIDFPTQIKLALTNELSSLKEVTDYECGPRLTLQTLPEGDCTPINVYNTHHGDTSFSSFNAFAENSRQPPFLNLLTNFCESLVMDSIADAETEVSVFRKKEKKSVCFVDNSFAGEANDNRKNEHCRLGEEELGLLRKYYLDLDFDDETSDHVYNHENQDALESLVDANDESDYKDDYSTSSEEDIYRNSVYMDNQQIYNYGNPLAYSLHTIVEESESESLPATPASSESSTSEPETLQSNSKVYENIRDPIFISEDCNASESICGADPIAIASSRFKEKLATGLFTLAECSRSNNESHFNVDQVDSITNANFLHSKADEVTNSECCPPKHLRCGNMEHKFNTDLKSDFERNEPKVRPRESKIQKIVSTSENCDSVNGCDDSSNVSSVTNSTEKVDKCQALISPLEVLESQITRLMLAVSPENSSVSDNNSYCGSTVESNNSDYGSDVVELTEYSSDEEKSHNLLNKITGNSPGIVRRESERSVAESIDSNVSEETVYICQRLMNSLKKLTHFSFTDDPENGTENSDFVKAKAYIREQIIELMHTVQSSSDQNSPIRQRKTENKVKNCNCQEQNEQCIACDAAEFTESSPKNDNSTKKTPSESGSETISVSVSIPSYGDSENATTECEISHEMEELFAMISDNSELENIPENAVCCEEDNSSLKSWEARISLFSNVKAAIEMESKRKAADKSPTAEEVTNNCQEITVNGVDVNVTEDQESASNNSLTSISNSHKTVVKIDESIRADNISPLFESLKDRSFSSDSVSSIQTVKARSVNLTAASISELSSEENVCNSRTTVDEQKSDLQSGASVVRKSFNAKEKASSENNLLVVNFMSQTKTSSGGTKVTTTKSTGNISDMEVTCSKGTFRDTGYYSFKSSEESVKSLGTVDRSSPPLNYSTLPICKSHPFTETIFEVEEEQDVIAPSLTKRRFTRATNHSLSSSNIPDDIFKGSKTNSLPSSCRNKNALLSSVSQRARSSFFSTSGVLRKLSLLRDDKSLGRKLRAKVRTSSGGTMRSSGGGLPHISVSDYSESLSNRVTASPAERERKEEDLECPTAYYSRSQTSLSSFGVRSESMSSIYSAAGGGRYGVVNISGEILFSLSYNYKVGVLEVLIKECRNLAAVDAKRNRSDPYVKVYLLPDRTKAGKRKTKVKKHTLDPVFDEVLKFDASLDELDNKTLWLSIWHSDIFGRNDFLGEVTLPLARDVFKNSNLRWFPLQDKIDAMDHCCKGNLFVALKYIPFDTSNCKRTKRVKGTLHVMVKEAHNLMPTRSNGTADPFCKCYLLPDRSKTGKQKTAVIKKTCDPKWNHTFIYDDVNIDDLKDRCLELTVWDYDKLTSNDFLGGVRLSLGTGKHCDQQVDWMDSNGEEITLWQQMLERLNMWVYGELRLRPTLQSRH